MFVYDFSLLLQKAKPISSLLSPLLLPGCDPRSSSCPPCSSCGCLTGDPTQFKPLIAKPSHDQTSSISRATLLPTSSSQQKTSSYKVALSSWRDHLGFPGDAGGNTMYLLCCSEGSQAWWEHITPCASAMIPPPKHTDQQSGGPRQGPHVMDPRPHHFLVVPPSLA